MRRDGRLRLGVLASHGGSNLQALIDAAKDPAYPAQVVVVISNNSGSGAMQRAAREGIAGVHLSSVTHPDPQALDQAIADTLQAHGVELVILAGYMRKIGPLTLRGYRHRILNIHPALLPDFGGEGCWGRHVHEAVLAAGAQESGPTVFLVTEHYDTGPILAQARVPVLPGDDADTLAARVLKQEHKLYPEVVRRIAAGEMDLDQVAGAG